MSQVARRWLLSVLGPVFKLHVRLILAGGAECRPVCPGGTGFHLGRNGSPSVSSG